MSDILTAHLINRLDPRFSVDRDTNEKQLKNVILRKFKKSRPSAIINILKLKTETAKERIIKTAELALEENNQQFIKFMERKDLEIKERNQSNNAHLDNRLIRIRQKLKLWSSNDKQQAEKNGE